jgi:hypothetical protein
MASKIIFWFRKILGDLELPSQLAASQGKLSSTEVVLLCYLIQTARSSGFLNSDAIMGVQTVELSKFG